jgi:hypothetical protein
LKTRSLFSLMRLAFTVTCLFAAAIPVRVAAQVWVPESPTAPYPPRWTIGVFGQYSPNSSHIILGYARKREFYSPGVAFTRRLAVGRTFTLSYLAEMRPFTLWSDPVLRGITDVYTSPQPPHTVNVFLHQQPPVLDTYPRSLPFQFVDPNTGIFYQGTEYFDYGRRYLYSGGLSPVGFKLNLRPQTRLQPVITVTGGFMASFRDLPVFDSSAINLTFSVGAGVEWFQTQSHSLRVEYRVQHLSNAGIGVENPGVDSQVIQGTWSWGRH